MLGIIKKVSEFIGLAVSFVCPASLPKLLMALLSHVYTGFLRRRFMELGRDTLIAYKASNLHGLGYISIGDGSKISKGVQLTAWKSFSGTNGVIEIGKNCNIRDNAHITAVERIVIGDNLLTGTNVLITDNSHGTTNLNDMLVAPDRRNVVSCGAVVIGDNVWLGNNVCIMPGVKIGNGVIVGANSVVTKDIPDYSVAVGSPAKVVKTNRIKVL